MAKWTTKERRSHSAGQVALQIRKEPQYNGHDSQTDESGQRAQAERQDQLHPERCCFPVDLAVVSPSELGGMCMQKRRGWRPRGSREAEALPYLFDGPLLILPDPYPSSFGQLRRGVGRWGVESRGPCCVP